MKSTLIPAMLMVILLAPTTSWTAGEPGPQGEAATTAGQSNLRLWNDPGAIEGLKNVLFDFDTHETASEHAVLEANAQWLKDHPDVRFKLAAYTDPRGDLVYNLALSQRRADTVKRELIQMGVAEDRISFATGWGELYPNCLESTEECWTQNRRVVFVHANP